MTVNVVILKEDSGFIVNLQNRKRIQSEFAKTKVDSQWIRETENEYIVHWRERFAMCCEIVKMIVNSECNYEKSG